MLLNGSGSRDVTARSKGTELWVLSVPCQDKRAPLLCLVPDSSYLASVPTAPQSDFQPPREHTVPWAILTICKSNSLCEADVRFLETLSLSSNSICMDSDLANFILVPALQTIHLKHRSDKPFS